MIYVEDIVLKRNENCILNGINVTFQDGHCYGIKGINGSGKTVFFRVVCGFWKPNSGRVYVNKKCIGKDIPFLENAGVIVGETTFISGMSGYQNLCALAEIKKNISREQIYESLKLVNLYDDRNKKYRKYSLGMKQKLRLAQAFMENPDILILDEPFNGLDKVSADKIKKYILKLKEEGKLILISSHNSDDIESLCDYIYEIEEGKLVPL